MYRCLSFKFELSTKYFYMYISFHMDYYPRIYLFVYAIF